MKKIILFVIFLLCLHTTLFANTNIHYTEIPHAEQWYEDHPGELPIWLTEEEKLHLDEIGKDFRPTLEPPAPVRQHAEFEPMQGVLISYPNVYGFGISTSIIAEMAEDVIVYCVVSSYSQTAAYNTLNNGGVNMSNVEFLIADTDTYWIRDYGPWFIFNGNNEPGITDYIYNRPRPDDNAIPSFCATYFGINLYSMGLTATGGNYMTDGHGISVSTDLVYDENRLSFESGSFDSLWVFNGDSNWFIDNIGYNKNFSTRSGEISNNESTILSINLSDIDSYGVIRFFKKVSCENSPSDNADYLAFFIDGIEKDRWDGEIDWSEEVFNIYSPNYHTLFEWKYIKNSSISAGDDCAWIDYIEFPISEPTIPKEIVHIYSEEYLGVNNYHVVPDVNGDYIKHIDCWGKYLSPTQILIREVPSSHSQYSLIEQAVDYFESQSSCYGTNYEVPRVYTPNNQPYTNSLILNNKVLVPITGSSYDAPAIASYEAAMPGYEVLGFTGSWYSTDALHCRAMGVTDQGMLYIYHVPVSDTITTSDDIGISANIFAYSGQSLISDSLLVYWKRSTDINFNELTLSHIFGNVYSASIPAQPNGTIINYYIHAADNSGRSENNPYIGAPMAYSFYVINPVSVDEPQQNVITEATNYPNPFSSNTTIAFTLKNNSFTKIELGIYNIKGQLIKAYAVQPTNNLITVNWDGTDHSGSDVPSGVYFYRINLDGKTFTQKMMKVR